jgi:transposase InsO family protein
MPLKVMDIVEQRLAVLQEPDWSTRSVAEVCRRHGISRETFYDWRRRRAEQGLAGLVPRSRRPEHSPGQLAAELEDRIVRLRKEYGWGPRKIRDRLRLDGDWPVPAVSTVQQALGRRGYGPLRKARAAPRSDGQRFVRAASNELWQIDGAQYRLADGTPYWAVELIDDHSRFCPVVRVGPGLTGQLAWTALRTGVARYGMPAELLSDNGLCFTGRLQGFVVSFERQVAQAGIHFAHSRPYHPQCCGKVERLHQTVEEFLAHRASPKDLRAAQRLHDQAFRRYYNEERPHQGLAGALPASVYRPGAGVLLPVIDLEPADVNPPGCVRRQVTQHGHFRYGYRFWQVSARYAGVTVGVLRDGSNLHVFYGSALIETFFVGRMPTPNR